MARVAQARFPQAPSGRHSPSGRQPNHSRQPLLKATMIGMWAGSYTGASEAHFNDQRPEDGVTAYAV